MDNMDVNKNQSINLFHINSPQILVTVMEA